MMENQNLEVYYVVKIIADTNGIDEELISKIENYGDVKVTNKLIEIVTDPSMLEVDNWDIQDKIVICIAVNVGNVRLIDNVYFN